MKKVQLLWVALYCTLSMGQERPSPYTAVESFFVAFHAKDSTGMQQLMSPKARLMRSTLKKGEPIVQENNVNRFIRAVATRNDVPAWKERLGKPIIQQHLNLATVWVPFLFYLDETLSHCGYNAFTLSWDGQQWTILSLIDTGTKDCDTL